MATIPKPQKRLEAVKQDTMLFRTGSKICL
jgi:hypothetical protein